MGALTGTHRGALALATVAVGWLAGCGGGADQPRPTASPPTPARSAQTSAKARPSEDLASICPQLAAQAKRIAARVASSPPGPLRMRKTRSLHLTGCRVEGNGLKAHLAIDSAPDARQRYSNRMVESYQFGSGAGATSSGLRPRTVPGLGDRNVEGGGANWLPIYNQLLSVRGPRVLIVGLYVKGASDTQLKPAAVQLSRRAYVLLDRR
jgi:hypothetical protein